MATKLNVTEVASKKGKVRHITDGKHVTFDQGQAKANESGLPLKTAKS